ncbi:ABC transporter ATP-binding protein [bacterium]|nr:ABC transporter ATP-binding protein [bacterium]
MSNQLIQVQNLKTYFYTEDGAVPAVDGVSFTISEGETLGIVGESGCGKSVTALSILRLIPQPPGKIVEGNVFLRDIDLLTLSEPQMRKVRGNEISMIFQEPMTSLNPVFKVGNQISEAIRLHQGLDKNAAWQKSIEALASVGIPSPQNRVNDYPHQMSGGMRQRVMIAMAISCNPSLLIADEPSTALDVTIQAQILDLMRQLQNDRKMAILLITHDLGVIAEMAHNVAVMYAGLIIESANVTQIFEHPLHPYTQGLLNSIPKLVDGGERLTAIEGVVPDPAHLPQGCRFEPRCKYAIERCKQEIPAPEYLEPEHMVRCFEAKNMRKGLLP